MAVREHEAVAVDPLRVARVVLEEIAPQDLGNVRHAHRGTGMAGIGALDGVHRERTDAIGQFASCSHVVLR